MKNETNLPAQGKVIAEIQAKQDNTVCPDTLHNSRGVDGFLWKGNPDAPLVQGIGAWIFGSAFILVGVVIAGIAYEKQDWTFGGLISIVWLVVGARVFLDGFRKRNSHP